MLLSEAFSCGRQSHLRLHASHGKTAEELRPIELTTTSEERSPLQAFIAEHWSSAKQDEERNLGIACYVESSQIFVGHREHREGSEVVTGSPRSAGPRSVASILLAEVMCTLLEAGLTLIAVIPPMEGSGLDDIGKPKSVVRGWFILFRGPEPCLAILDAFSQVGCLRNDFSIAFPIAPSESNAIGQGACALVHKLRNWNGQSLAVKKMNSTVGCATIAREMSTLIQVQSHENVIRVHGLFWECDEGNIRFSLSSERASSGDLLTKVCKDGVFREDDARPLFVGIVRGLAHIHSHQIVHRDIKTENILLDGRRSRKSLNAIIADFGLASWLSDDVQMAQRCGSPGYVAPEVCVGKKYDCKVDIFGVGVMLYFVLSKEMPFFGRDATATLKKTVACQLHLSRSPWNGLTSALRKMLRATICKSASERMDASEALEHAWVLMPVEAPGQEEPRVANPNPPSDNTHVRVEGVQTCPASIGGQPQRDTGGYT